MVAPITSTIRGLPSEVVVGAEEGLKLDSPVNLNHIQTIEQRHRYYYIGSLSETKMRRVCLAPLRDTTANVINRVQMCIEAWLGERSFAGRTIMQVHDGVGLEVPESGFEEARAGAQEYMNNEADLSVSLEVDIGVEATWDEVH